MGSISTQFEALSHGFRLADIERDGELLWGWRQGGVAASPYFASEEAAADWMDDLLGQRACRT